MYLKRRAISIIICCGLLANLLVGCGNDTTNTDNVSETESISETEADDAVTIETWETPIENLSDDFIMGVDLSSVFAEENSGVKYFNFEGEEQDVFKTFSEAGVNCIRLRVWNDPYDENGNGYGGGNNDIDTAIELGKRITANNMKTCIDFHYSDFWADTVRQTAPKAWEGMSVEEKCDALYEYTKESLTKLLEAGVDVSMIQIGNEINYGMAGETKTENVIELLKSGSKAIREVSDQYDRHIDIVIHYTKITDKGDVLDLVSKLVDSELDFDMVGMSYYPFWDGSMDNMKRVLELIQERYGKKAFIAETSYAYTLEDGDGSGNNFSSTEDIVKGYPVSVEGQAKMVHDICKAVNEVNGAGFFYWEGAWIPVGSDKASNSEIWEKYGSGWASSYAAGYDKQVGEYYGGSSWDNQAFFNHKGQPLDSINVFKYMRYGK